MTAKEEIIKNFAPQLTAYPEKCEEILAEALTTYDKLVKSQNEFHTSRRMFYIKNGNVIEPIDRYANLSHLEWFNVIQININNVVRGYCSSDGKFAMIYTGLDFKEPVMNIDTLIAIKKHFPTIEYIGSGCKINDFGNVWEPIRKIGVTIKENEDISLHFINN